MGRWLGDGWGDVRFAVRMLAKRPGFTAAAVLTLALGIGATTAVFSIVDAVLLRPLPYRDSDRLVAIWDKAPKLNLSKFFAGFDDFKTIRSDSKSFESVAAAAWNRGANRVLTGRGPARTVLAIPATAGFFETLGVSAALGRIFTEADEKSGCSIVLAHSFWTSTLGADPAIVGQTLTLDHHNCTVLGVMPADFTFYPRQSHMWVLWGTNFIPDASPRLDAGIFARLKPGVTLDQARAETAALHGALHQADGKEKDLEPDVNPLQGEFTFLAGRTLRTTLLVVFGAVGMVLLIACLNLSNLLLGRLAERHRELAVRAALGSGQSRLIRQVLTEGLLLSVGGAALGVALAAAGVRYFNSANPIELTAGTSVRVNLAVLGFSLLLAVTATLIFGLLPAIHVSRVDVIAKLRAAGRGSVHSAGRFGGAKALIAVEMGVSLALLTGAALLLESALRMGSADLGFDPRGVVVHRVTLPATRYSTDARRERFYRTILSGAQQLPGTQSAALASQLPPYLNGGFQLEVQGEGNGARPHDLGTGAISPGFFDTVRTRLVSGRDFNDQDRPDSEPVAIVNQALADEYFPHQNPLGKQIRVQEVKMPWLTIIGISGNIKHTELMNEMQWVETPGFYRPVTQDPEPLMALAIRTTGDSGPLGRAVQQLIVATDPDIPVSDPQPLDADLSKALEYPRFRAAILGMFALGALLLSAVGLYGVLSQLVAQRTAEFGLRRAVGAQTWHLLAMVARQGGVPVLIGVAGGIASSFAFARILTGLLYGIRPTDPALLALASAILCAVAGVAMLIPAWRASRVDPMTALRSE